MLTPSITSCCPTAAGSCSLVTTLRKHALYAKRVYENGSGAGKASKEQANSRQVDEGLAGGWVLERTFAWLLFNRRLSRDYECLCATSEAWIYLAMFRIMLRRRARLQRTTNL